MEHVTGNSPKSIAIIGCGPTMQDYVNIMASQKSAEFNVDEVWGINLAGAAIRTDLTFYMDDMALLKSLNADAGYENVPAPRITSVPRIEGDIAFPLAEILNIPGARAYLNHTAAYVMAYAIALGVESIAVFGCDYISKVHPYAAGDDDAPARYMACMAFWSGIAAARGIHVTVTPNSPLLDADQGARENFYGYIVPPTVKHEGE